MDKSSLALLLVVLACLIMLGIMVFSRKSSIHPRVGMKS